MSLLNSLSLPLLQKTFRKLQTEKTSEFEAVSKFDIPFWNSSARLMCVCPVWPLIVRCFITEQCWFACHNRPLDILWRHIMKSTFVCSLTIRRTKKWPSCKLCKPLILDYSAIRISVCRWEKWNFQFSLLWRSLTWRACPGLQTAI